MDLDDLEVEGYDFCPGCGDWVLAGKKMCGECARTLSEAADEVIVVGDSRFDEEAARLVKERVALHRAPAPKNAGDPR